MAKKLNTFIQLFAWNLAENLVSKWFVESLGVAVVSSLLLTAITSLVLLKYELVVSMFGIVAYFITAATILTFLALSVIAFSAINAIRGEVQNFSKILDDFMDGIALGLWMSALLNTVSDFFKSSFNMLYSSAHGAEVTINSPKKNPGDIGDFAAVEISVIEIKSEITSVVESLYKHLEEHFQNRAVELTIYHNAIRELGNGVEPALEREEAALRATWDELRELSKDPDPANFFEAVIKYLDETSTEIVSTEKMLDDKYDFDEDNNSLLFSLQAQKDTALVKEDLNQIFNERSSGFSHH